MRIDLKSLMILAHEIKARYHVSFAEALKAAWAKAKGFTYHVCVSTTAGRRWFFANSYDEANSIRIGYVNEIARARTNPAIRSTLGVIGSQMGRIVA